MEIEKQCLNQDWRLALAGRMRFAAAAKLAAAPSVSQAKDLAAKKNPPA
jgi:hypothetical protein